MTTKTTSTVSTPIPGGGGDGRWTDSNKDSETVGDGRRRSQNTLNAQPLVGTTRAMNSQTRKAVMHQIQVEAIRGPAALRLGWLQ